MSVTAFIIDNIDNITEIDTYTTKCGWDSKVLMYYKPLIYQTFPVTNNQKNWEKFLPLGQFSVPIFIRDNNLLNEVE